jgi:hypothetical protein
LASKLVGHERINVTWQFVASGATVIASVVVAVIAVVETIGWRALKTSFGAILTITAWALRRAAAT